MNLNDTKSSETLRKEISQDLDRLDNKVDRLKDRMTPGQFLDDAVFSSYRGNPRETFNYLRRNPVGASFLAIGSLLLMDNEGESYEQYLRRQGSLAYRDYRDKAVEAKGSIGHRIDEIKDDVRHRAQGFVEKGERGIQRVKEKSEGIKKQVSSTSERIKSEFSRRTEGRDESLSESNSEFGSEIKDNFSEVRNNVIDATESFRERGASSLNVSDTGVSSKINQAKDSVRQIGEKAMGRIKENQIDSLGYVALGGTLGFVTGGLVPFSEEELESVSSEFDFSSLRTEIEQAANESINIFKNEFIETFKNSSLDIFS